MAFPLEYIALFYRASKGSNDTLSLIELNRL